MNVALLTFTYFTKFGSCMGRDETEGYGPNRAVALEGVHTHELSLGDASDDSTYSPASAPTICKLYAIVRVKTPDTEYRIKWGDRDWDKQTAYAASSLLDVVTVRGPGIA